MDYYTLGNRQILELPKTAFLCSRTCPANIILKSYDWAIAQREAGNCIISGFHSRIERDVFHYLLQGRQPAVLVLARGMRRRWEPEILRALAEERLLIMSPFPASIRRPTAETARRRNRFMAELADQLFIAYAAEGGNIAGLLRENAFSGKAVQAFDIPENRHLRALGVELV